jgi:hypothetical protein
MTSCTKGTKMQLCGELIDCHSDTLQRSWNELGLPAGCMVG